MTHLDEVFDEYPMTRKERRLARRKATRPERSPSNKKNKSQNTKQVPTLQGMELKRIFPKTANQERMFDCFEHEENILALGYAGTGKTFLLTYLCINEILNNPDKRYKKLIIARSALASRDQGFLPGTEEQKAAVFEQPYADAFKKLFGRGDAYEILKKMGIVEFKTTSYIRGITLDDCLVIVDEGQNLTWVEISGMITRMGDNTRIHIAGDHRQSDHKFADERSGFINFLKVVKHMSSFGIVEMEIDDIVRGPIVKEFILRATQQGLM